MAFKLFLAVFFCGVHCVCGDLPSSYTEGVTWPRQDVTDSVPNIGIAVSGGLHTSNSVEVFVPSTNKSCSLPPLPDDHGRYDQTMDSLYICGGDWSTKSCLQLDNGQWTNSHTLVRSRRHHCSWETEFGMVLMGGSVLDGSGSTSEMVRTGGGQGGATFDMKYNTVDACAIPDLITDSVFITGGGFTLQTVSRYDLLGWLEDLPQLKEGRHYHGCGSYFRGDGTQVLLVAGGWDDDSTTIRSSTEVLIGDSSAWTMANPLPRAVFSVASVTLDNTVYFTGGTTGGGIRRAEVLAWSDEQWVEKGQLREARKDHAATTIKMDQVMAMGYCG